MIKLYQFSACPFCWKVRVLLNYKGIPFEAIEVHPRSKKELEFTDHKKVPVLVDGKTIVTESAKIMDYLSNKYDVSLPKDDESEWCAWVDDTLVHYLPPIIHRDFKTSFNTIGEATKTGRSNWLSRFFTRLMGAAIMSKVAKKKALKLGITDPITELKTAIDKWVNKGLKGQAFCGGNQISIADLSVFGVFRSTEQLEVVDIACEHEQAFAAWYAKCKELTAC